MEEKKSAKADLEGQWWQRFVLGLVVSLAALFVALEYTIEPEDPLDDPELQELFANDEELAPLLRMENQVVLVEKKEPDPSVKLTVVEEDEEQAEEEERQPEKVLEGEPADEEGTVDEPKEKDNEEVLSFRVVEDVPQFPGGYGEFMKWLTKNLKYPVSVQQRHQQGRVIAEFIINKDGSVTDVRVVGSMTPECDNEVLRVLRMMPRWTAGVMNDKPCRAKVVIPVVFKL